MLHYIINPGEIKYIIPEIQCNNLQCKIQDKLEYLLKFCRKGQLFIFLHLLNIFSYIYTYMCT